MPLDPGRRKQYTRRVEENFPEELTISLRKKLPLRSGMNPGNPGVLYIEDGASGNMADLEVLQEGKGPGFINFADMDLGQIVVKSIRKLDSKYEVCCIVKHEIPSAVARAENTYGAFIDAWDSDPLSSFGGVHVFSGEVKENLAGLLIESTKNVEVVYAPDFSMDALSILAKRASLRVVKMSDINKPSIDSGLECKRLEGGFLVEPRQRTKIRTGGDLECISKRNPTESEIRSAIFNWNVAYYTRSNAVVIGTEDKTHGIGSGQRSRIAAAVQAVDFANGFNERYKGYGSRGTVMASDAYIPQTDVIELAADSRITGIILPLGSIRDNDVVEAADDKGIFLLATRKPGTHDSERAFTHR